MSEQENPLRDGEQEAPASGLFLSVDPLTSGAGLRAADSDGSDSSGITGGDSDTTDMGDSDASDTLGGDSDGSDMLGGDSDASDGSDTDASDAIGLDTDGGDASDSDGTDGGADQIESESGLGGENPLGLNRTRAIKNGDDKDTRDS